MKNQHDICCGLARPENSTMLFKFITVSLFNSQIGTLFVPAKSIDDAKQAYSHKYRMIWAGQKKLPEVIHG